MSENGVRVICAEEDFVVHPPIVDDLAKAGVADVVFLGVKAHSLPDLAPCLRTLIGPDTIFNQYAEWNSVVVFSAPRRRLGWHAR